MSIIFFAVSLVGLLMPVQLFMRDYCYAFYAGPDIDVVTDANHVSICTSPNSATEWYTHLYSETDDLDVFNASYVTYQLSEDYCTIEAHDYCVYSLSPLTMTERIDVRYSVTTRFILEHDGVEIIIETLSKNKHEEYSEEDVTINLRELEEGWNLTRPYTIYTETFVDYEAENSICENSTSYSVMDFRLHVGDDLTVEHFADVPYMVLSGYSDRVYTLREMGWVMLVLGVFALLLHRFKGK